MNKIICNSCREEFAHPDYLKEGKCYGCTVAALEGKMRAELWAHMHDEHKLTLLESEIDEIVIVVGKAKDFQIENLMKGVNATTANLTKAQDANRSLVQLYQELTAGLVEIASIVGNPPLQVARTIAMRQLAKAGVQLNPGANGHSHGRIIQS